MSDKQEEDKFRTVNGYGLGFSNWDSGQPDNGDILLGLWKGSMS